MNVHGRAGWFGPKSVVNDPVVAFARGRVMYIGRAHGAPAAEEEISGDWFLMPAPIDHHVHIGLSRPDAVLRGGIAVVRDLGWPPADIFPLSDASELSAFDGPRIRPVGPMITKRGGYPADAGWAPPGTAHEIDGPEEAIAAVDWIRSQGAVAIKVALDAEAGPVLDDEELVAIIEAAHERRRPVTAHVRGKGQTERALGAGVDELAHAPWSEALSDDLIKALARSVRVVSTLDIHARGTRQLAIRAAIDNLRRFHAAGGRVFYGTDLGNGPIPPGVHLGEVEHLATAGLSNEEILVAMTGTHHGPTARGDLVALGGSPLSDLRYLADVRLVVAGGRVRYRSA